jgi:hypothetical protein
MSDQDTQEFPKMLYHKGNVKEQKVVNSAEDEDALGEDWVDQPIPSDTQPD